VLLFLCSLAFVLYLDRVCISQAVVPIQQELNLSNSQMSVVLAAFTLAYGLFEIPAGWWGDIVGARRVLTRISIWWSAFTALTGMCLGFYSLVVCRFLFGAGEAGAYPNAARVISRWFPRSERGRVQGLLQTTALVGGAGAPVCAAYLIAAVGWRATFVLFGATGVVWAITFYRWFRDSPDHHPRVNALELETIGWEPASGPAHVAVPWNKVLASPGILLLAAIMTCGSFNSYVYFSWFPKYLQSGREVSAETAGWLASMVLALAALGTLSGGVAADAILRRWPRPTLVRRVVGCSAYSISAVLLVWAVQCDSPQATALLAASSIMAAHLTIPTWWSCAIEISGRHIGALFGLMNGTGVIGAMSSQFMFGSFADWRQSQGYMGRDQWDPAFLIVAAVLMVAAVCWAFVDTSQAIDEAADTQGLEGR
jgi:MFS family permease